MARSYDEKRREIVARSYQKNKDKYRERAKQYALRKRKVKGVGLIDTSVFVQKYLEQDGKCEICQLDIPMRGNTTHFDHDHDTLQLRGVLCTNCNTGLGQFKESETSLLSAIEYLRKYKGDK